MLYEGVLCRAVYSYCICLHADLGFLDATGEHATGRQFSGQGIDLAVLV